jgi:transposase InsO family protein
VSTIRGKLTLKTEIVHQREHPDREAARHDLLAHIKDYYNRQWIRSAVGYITPEQADRKPHSPVSTLLGKAIDASEGQKVIRI